jgi:hypothetical protein
MLIQKEERTITCHLKYTQMREQSIGQYQQDFPQSSTHHFIPKTAAAMGTRSTARRVASTATLASRRLRRRLEVHLATNVQDPFVLEQLSGTRATSGVAFEATPQEIEAEL